MANSLTNIVQVLRSLLISDSVVSGFVGDNIHTAHIYDADAGTVPMPCLILELESGFGMYNRTVQFQDYDLYAYSKISQAEAMQVYNAAYDALQACRLSLDGVSTKGLITERSRPVSGYNDRLMSWWVRGSWHVAAAG